jgi:hypothetical protein
LVYGIIALLVLLQIRGEKRKKEVKKDDAKNGGEGDKKP